MRSRLVALVAVVVTACGGASPASVSSTTAPTAPTTSTSSSTTQPAPTTSTVPPVEPADLILFGGVILTMDPDRPVVEAVAVRDGEIAAIGGTGVILQMIDRDTRLIDLRDRVVMPGFVDAHSHILNEGAYGVDLAERQSAALAHGITTLGNLYTDREFLEAMRSFDDAGLLQVRASLYLVGNLACGDPYGEWYLEIPPTRERGEMLRIGGVKVYADGGSCNPPSFSRPLTAGGPVVEPYLTAEELAEIVRRADEAGHQVAIHAIGDRALDVAFDGLEGALGGAPNVRRHRIEHNSVVRPDQYARYGELGVVATIFGDYPSCSPIGGPLLPEVQDWEWPYDELMAANPGARFAWHGDAPYFSIDPLHQLFGFVTRHDVADDGSICAPHAYLADDVIPVEVALRLMTVESAYALFREMEVGSLRPGWLADLIVIDGNPLLVDPFSIKDLTVRMTMVGGEVVHCLDEELCP